MYIHSIVWFDWIKHYSIQQYKYYNTIMSRKCQDADWKCFKKLLGILIQFVLKIERESKHCNNTFFKECDMHNNTNMAAIWWSIKWLNTYIFKIMISFLAAFLTFLPSFLWNFLQVYILRVFRSFARNISQNSSLRKKRFSVNFTTYTSGFVFFLFLMSAPQHRCTHDLTICPRSYLSVTSEGLL